MKSISEIINMMDLHYYTYQEEFKIFQCMGDKGVSTVYHQRELIKIIDLLDNKNVTYTVDEKYNIYLYD